MLNIKSNEKVAVVIVLYNPNTNEIDNVRRIAQDNVGVVVDNSMKPFMVSDTIGKMSYICNMANLGIAEAQNIALREILKDNYAYVVFLDQDSRVAVDYPLQIAKEFSRIDNGKLAVLGPQVVNSVTGEQYTSAFHKYETSDNGYSLRKHIISSGSCISINALKNVGLMCSELFIDYVDFEWCWRAGSKGYLCCVTSNLQILHHVGQRELSFGRYKVIISAPKRYFYQYRNYLWLIRKKYVPLQWKCATGIKFFLRLLYFPIFVRGGLSCWIHMTNGIKAGFKK